MTRAYVSVGSNLQPARNVREAVHLLAQRERVTAISTVYCTAPDGRPEQLPYYNCVVELETSTPPERLKRDVLQAIESVLGRERGPDRWAPRTMDLDLIVYDDLVLHEPGLELPDPHIAERAFVVLPLKELAPGLVLPGTRTPVLEAAAHAPPWAMKALPKYTALLREEMAYMHGYPERMA